MNKSVSFIVSAILAVSLISNLFINVYAGTEEENGNNPTVTWFSGDAVFTTTYLPIDKLPGVETLPGGMLGPIGIPAGEAQFGEKGVKISGLSDGVVTICFPIKSVELNQGWGGKIGFWTGSKWKLLKTTFATTQEDPTSMACTSITRNGSYTLIKWIADSSKLPQTNEISNEISSSCDYVDSIWTNVIDVVRGDNEIDFSGTIDELYFVSSKNLAGKTVTAIYLGSIPEGSQVITGSFSGVLVLSEEEPNTYILSGSGTIMYYDGNHGNHWSIDFGDCTQDLVQTY
jgi:hypothetical protein